MPNRPARTIGSRKIQKTQVLDYWVRKRVSLAKKTMAEKGSCWRLDRSSGDQMPPSSYLNISVQPRPKEASHLISTKSLPMIAATAIPWTGMKLSKFCLNLLARERQPQLSLRTTRICKKRCCSRSRPAQSMNKRTAQQAAGQRKRRNGAGAREKVEIQKSPANSRPFQCLRPI